VEQEVYFQTLLIAKIVELLAHPTVGLTLEYFCRDEAFEQSRGMVSAQARPMMSAQQ